MPTSQNIPVPMGAPLGMAVIGYGFMGQTHARAIHAARRAGRPCVLRSVCDPRADAVRSPSQGNITSANSEDDTGIDLSGVRTTTRVEDVLRDPQVHAVSICSPTDTHVGLALACLHAGKHVLIEKPVAISSHEIDPLIAAQQPGSVVMPAMCMRFWPGWKDALQAIATSTFGELRSLTLRRLGAMPAWGNGFYADRARSGGMLFDLHIHDADAVVSALGMPTHVACHGHALHTITHYRFAGTDAPITVENAWDMLPEAGFHCSLRAACARATLDFVMGQAPAFTIATAGGVEHPVLPTATGYDREVEHFVDVVVNGAVQEATLEDSLRVTRLLEITTASLSQGGVWVSV